MNTEYRYLDILWIDNLIMNFVLLWITSRVSRHESRIWRLWLAAGVGAVYAVMLFLPGFEVFRRFTMKIALSLCMLLIAFQFKDIKEFLKLLGVFYGSTFAFGGAALGLYYFTSDTIAIENGVFYIKNYPVKVLILSCIVAIMLFRVVWLFIRNRLSHQDLIFKAEIAFDGKCVMLDALLDTGNALSDPISHAPVIVVEFDTLKEVMPVQISSMFINNQEDDLEMVTRVVAESSWVGRFRMIPFTALGKPNGMLIGFKPDKVRIWNNKAWQEIRNVIIGVYNNKLSKGSQYQALMHPEIIN